MDLENNANIQSRKGFPIESLGDLRKAISESSRFDVGTLLLAWKNFAANDSSISDEEFLKVSLQFGEKLPLGFKDKLAQQIYPTKRCRGFASFWVFWAQVACKLGKVEEAEKICAKGLSSVDVNEKMRISACLEDIKAGNNPEINFEQLINSISRDHDNRTPFTPLPSQEVPRASGRGTLTTQTPEPVKIEAALMGPLRKLENKLESMTADFKKTLVPFESQLSQLTENVHSLSSKVDGNRDDVRLKIDYLIEKVEKLEKNIEEMNTNNHAQKSVARLQHPLPPVDFLSDTTRPDLASNVADQSILSPLVNPGQSTRAVQHKTIGKSLLFEPLISFSPQIASDAAERPATAPVKSFTVVSDGVATSNFQQDIVSQNVMELSGLYQNESSLSERAPFETPILAPNQASGLNFQVSQDNAPIGKSNDPTPQAETHGPTVNYSKMQKKPQLQSRKLESTLQKVVEGDESIACLPAAKGNIPPRNINYLVSDFLDNSILEHQKEIKPKSEKIFSSSFLDCERSIVATDTRPNLDATTASADVSLHKSPKVPENVTLNDSGSKRKETDEEAPDMPGFGHLSKKIIRDSFGVRPGQGHVVPATGASHINHANPIRVGAGVVQPGSLNTLKVRVSNESLTSGRDSMVAVPGLSPISDEGSYASNHSSLLNSSSDYSSRSLSVCDLSQVNIFSDLFASDCVKDFFSNSTVHDLPGYEALTAWPFEEPHAKLGEVFLLPRKISAMKVANVVDNKCFFADLKKNKFLVKYPAVSLRGVYEYILVCSLLVKFRSLNLMFDISMRGGNKPGQRIFDLDRCLMKPVSILCWDKPDALPPPPAEYIAVYEVQSSMSLQCLIECLPRPFTEVQTMLLAVELILMVENIHKCDHVIGDLSPESLLARRPIAVPTRKEELFTGDFMGFLLMSDLKHAVDMASFPKGHKFNAIDASSTLIPNTSAVSSFMKNHSHWSYDLDCYTLGCVVAFIMGIDAPQNGLASFDAPAGYNRDIWANFFASTVGGTPMFSTGLLPSLRENFVDYLCRYPVERICEDFELLADMLP